MDSKPDSPAQENDLLRDCVECWHRLPNKAFFFCLLMAWMLLFQFYGNSTFGYIDTASLPNWMYKTYTNPLGSGEDGQGVAIPFLVAGLFIWKRKELLALRIELWSPGLMLLGFALSLHAVAYMVQQPKMSIVAMFTGIFGLMGLAWGPAWLRKSVFPFFLFIFSIPISSMGGTITFPLRIFVVKLVAIISNYILAVHIRREGTQLFNPQHTYSYDIVAACSGLQSLVAVFLLATVYAFVSLDTNWKRLLMIAFALPLAIVANTIRLLCIIIAAEIFGQQGGNYVHESPVFSILPYGPALIGVILFGNWLQKSSKPKNTPAPEVA